MHLEPLGLQDHREVLIDRLSNEKKALRQEKFENPPDTAVDASTDLDASGVHPDASQKEASREKNCKIREMDAQDASDAKIPTHSISKEDDFLEGEDKG